LLWHLSLVLLACWWLQVAQHRAEVMVASHNQASIERTVAGNAAAADYLTPVLPCPA
jgi:hypothetical protein